MMPNSLLMNEAVYVIEELGITERFPYYLVLPWFLLIHERLHFKSLETSTSDAIIDGDRDLTNLLRD